MDRTTIGDRLDSGHTRRLVAAAVVTLLGVGLVGSASTAPARAEPSPNLIAWTAQSDANFVDVVVDNTSGLAGVHPLSELDIPEDSSDFQTGPFGYGLATLLWPGAAAGNLGSVSGELGLPSQLASLTGRLNDPVRAEAFFPGAKSTATYPPGFPQSALEMISHADGNGSWAKASVADAKVPGFLAVSSVQGSTTATATTEAESQASGSFQSLELLGGLIQIGATTSSARAVSDGVSPEGTATTHIGAIKIAGVPVSVGSDGLVVGPASSGAPGAAGTLLTSFVNQLVSALNLKLTSLPATQTSQAPAEKITSGGLQISFALPPSLSLSLDCALLPPSLAQLGAVCHLPDELQGLSFVTTIGRVTATAIAAPPFPTVLGSGSAAPPSPLISTPTGTPPPAITPSSNLTAGAPSGLSTAPASTQSTPLATPAASPRQSLIPISLSSPIKTGFLVFLGVLSAAVSLLLRRVRRALDAPQLAPCPLEDSS